MRTIVVIATSLMLAGCGGLYPGLTMGACGPQDKGKHTVYDLGGIPECVPDGTQTASSHWLD